MPVRPRWRRRLRAWMRRSSLPLAALLFAALFLNAGVNRPLSAADVPHLTIPEKDDGLPGAGPIRDRVPCVSHAWREVDG